MYHISVEHRYRLLHHLNGGNFRAGRGIARIRSDLVIVDIAALINRR